MEYTPFGQTEYYLDRSKVQRSKWFSPRNTLTPPKHRLIQQEISYFGGGGGGGGAGGGIGGAVFLPSPSPFTLLSLRL